MRALGAWVAVWVMAGPAAAQGHAHGGAQRSNAARAAFVAEAREAAAAFADPVEAMHAGYRRLGPDFPGMGVHWVHPALILSGALQASRPPLLAYTDIDGRPTLVSVAYALPLAPGEEPPDEPLGAAVWHDHAGAVDEEALLLTSMRSSHAEADGHRVAMVHVWTMPNPEGDLAQNNWTLPYLRAGLPVPDSISLVAARGLSLLHQDGRFYRDVIRNAVPLSPEELRRVDAALERAVAAVGKAVGEPDRKDHRASFQEAWLGFWARVSDILANQRWEALAAFVDGGPSR